MTSPVVHQVDGGQEVRLEQLARVVEEELPLLGVDVALYLGPVVVELVEGDPGVDILVEVEHVVHLRSIVSISLHDDQCSECYETAHNVTISNQTNHGKQ